jgi:quercetin dioxygenase-like cupin family protein
VVSRDGTVIRLTPGDTVWTLPGEEHWHGAGAGCMMSHLAMLEGTDDGDGTSWLEPVTDEEYLPASQN